jgi:hypothetical protein
VRDHVLDGAEIGRVMGGVDVPGVDPRADFGLQLGCHGGSKLARIE